MCCFIAVQEHVNTKELQTTHRFKRYAETECRKPPRLEQEEKANQPE